MPRKSRTPPPPRRVQAPKTRQAERSAEERRAWRILLIAGGLGFVGLAVALGILLFFGGGNSAGTALADAGCTVQTFPGQPASHVGELPEDFEYNSDPPTSGLHHPVAAPFDVYDQPVEPIRFVHNLEHGGVVVLYGDNVPNADVVALIEWYRGDPNGILIAPYPQNGDRITLSAWTAEVDPQNPQEATNERGVLARCPGFSEDAFDAFLDEYGFGGPERFPRDQLTPGS
ncbi:MAG: DUF3105 domain-containing protein [Actinomycetota bacterium]|nr:DUF3105 domain-containing protein [Actinomycetota bacterium]